MSKSFVSLCLLRVIYPLCLTTCVSCRQDLITGVLLLFVLYVPFVPLPTPYTMTGHTGIFLKLSFIVSTMMMLLQAAFQIFLLSNSPYGSVLHEYCSPIEQLIRQLGFIRYDSLSAWNCVWHIAPEVIALFVSFFVYVVCDRLNAKNLDADSVEQGLLESIIRTPENTTAQIRQCLLRKKALLASTIFGKYVCLAMLCFASILVPSITSACLYLLFVCSITYWACYKDLNKGFAYLCRFICILLFLYIFAVFCYQMPFFQHVLPPSSRIPRYFGLQALKLTNCSDPRVFVTSATLKWSSFVLPYALLVLYYLLIFESKMLLFIAEVNGYLMMDTMSTAVATESTPLIRGRESVYRRSNVSAICQDSHGSITVPPPVTAGANITTTTAITITPNTIANTDVNRIKIADDEIMENEESFKVDIFDYLVDAFITLIGFITRTSYIGTNIIMMAWSITYHSWLTFILLLGAIILWMVPNQRQSMLRVSPFLIFYAEFLLVVQYFYGMDLNKEELSWPTTIFGVKDLTQIGFLKSDNPVKDLAIKTLFTTMFWITMRQYMQEREECRTTSTVARMMAPVQVTVGTATAMGGDPSSKGGQIIQKFGQRVRKFLTKFWIWVVTITLFGIGIVGDDMTLFRIIYTALALTFIITFQLSWSIWRKTMYGFWLTVIVLSMVILVLIYTFQFKDIPPLWEKIGINAEWQAYIGLKPNNSADSFFFLIIPTFFVIITVIQLKYFHKDFLLISDIKSRGTSTTRPKSRPSIVSDDEYTQTEEVSSKTEATEATEGTSLEDAQSPNSTRSTRKTLVEREVHDFQPSTSRPSFHVFGHSPNVKTLQTFDKIKYFVKDGVEIMWLFFELHIKKFILILVTMVSISDVNVIHLGFILGAVAAMMLNSKFQDIVIRLMSVSAAVALLAEMIFQIDHFKVEQWTVNCSTTAANNTNKTRALLGTDWLGFYKIGNHRSMLQLLSGYIWIILAVTIYVVVLMRQKYVRHVRGRPLSRCRLLFPRVSYRQANDDVLRCVQYLFNYAFFRFGVEITFISIVILIGTRLNLIALMYAVWLLLLMVCARPTLSKIWYFFNWFIAITIPLEYAVCVGLPPEFCFTSFKADGIVEAALKFSFLPVNHFTPNAKDIFWDFMVLLFVTRQMKVFRIEYQHRDNDYPGGSNKSIIHEMESPNYVNPVPDFISEKKSYLDIIKHGVLCSLLWISCAVAFLAGTYNVTLFSFGYIVGSFLILWQGNDFYLRPISAILKWWNRFLIYNVSVIFLKALFQIPGCIFTKQIAAEYCGLAKLFGIGCIDNFDFFTAFLVGDVEDPLTKALTECRLTLKPGGMGPDAMCFILLIFQKRLFSSHYFVRIVDEAKAMAVLAARGAELIEELSRKQLQKQQELEKTVLQKIKNKMDSIKAAQKKIQGIKSKDPTTHHEAIRSGDYYMFDDEQSQNLIEVEGELTAVEEADEEYAGKTLGKLMESVMKSDLKHAIQSSSGDMSATELKSSTPKSKTASAGSSSGDDADEDDNECSTCQYKSTDATTSKDVTDSLDESSSLTLRRKRGSDKKRTSFKREDRERREREREQRDNDKDDTSDSDASTLKSSQGDSVVANCWDSFVTYLKFSIAFINCCMISMIQFLNRKSRDHRYVIQALEKEKKMLKETRNLRIGIRILPEMKWQPMPAGFNSQRPKSPLKIEDFESQGLVASSQPVFVRLLLAIYHALMSHSDMVCYFAVFILQIKSPTLASLPLSLMVFFWGTLSIPRPTKRFWVTIIAYTEFVVVIKNICQSEFVPLEPILDGKPFHWVRILGIEKDSNDAIYDLILLLAVFFHRSTLKSLGLWKSTEEFNKDTKATNLLNLNYVEPQRTSDSDMDAVTEVTTINLVLSDGDGGGGGGGGGDRSQSEEITNHATDSYQNAKIEPHPTSQPVAALAQPKNNPFESLVKSVREFFVKLIESKSRIADDVYAYMFFCDFCNIIVIIFGFSSFGTSKGDGGVTQYIEDNKIPFAFLAMVIIQFALIVVDRWLYLSRYILGKLAFQYLLVVVIHVWMFFILPAVTERRFNEALPPSLWYLIKCCYLLLSSYQIRSGYPTRILGNFLCKNYNLVNMVLFKVFMAIPFVYELRTLMDWIWTETSMTLADWIKMEDIFAQIFQLKCIRRAESKYPQPRSQKIPAKTKFMYGAGGLGVLFAIIWFPLVLFALGDTVGEPNIPKDVNVKVQISSYQAIYSSYASKISSLTDDQWGKIKKIYQSASAQTFLSDYYPEDVGVVLLPGYSSSVWSIPPPEMDELQSELKLCSGSDDTHKMKVSIEWTINRNSENPESPKEVTDGHTIILTPALCANFSKILSNFKSHSNATATDAVLASIMPKFIKVTSIGKATAVARLMNKEEKPNKDEDEVQITEDNAFIDLAFHLEYLENSSTLWWTAEQRIASNESFLNDIDKIVTANSTKPCLIMYTFNDKMFPPGLLSIISGKGIIGLYTTFVIFVGAIVKGYFTNTSSHIMFEDMPYVDRILQLCLDIFLVRERREFDLEEDLFAKLLFLYRSPETIIKWTRPPEDGGSDEY